MPFEFGADVNVSVPVGLIAAPDPCFDALASFERRKAALNLDEDVLQDVFGCGVVADSGADEGAKPARQRFPDAFHRRGHFRRSIRVRSTPRQA